jgi:hypothetical protein
MFCTKIRIGFLASLAALSFAMAIGSSAVPVPSDVPQPSADVNVSGIWESRDWEQCWLRQDGSNISGQLGDYQVQGIVTGHEIYMYLVYRGRVYHTLQLAQGRPNEMAGYYYYGLQSQAAMHTDYSVRRFPTIFLKVSNALPPR